MLRQKDYIMNQIEKMVRAITAALAGQSVHALKNQQELQQCSEDIIRSLTGLNADASPVALWAMVGLTADPDKKILLAAMIAVKYPDYRDDYDDLLASMDLQLLNERTLELIQSIKQLPTD